jgi:hypothetical protein
MSRLLTVFLRPQFLYLPLFESMMDRPLHGEVVTHLLSPLTTIIDMHSFMLWITEPNARSRGMTISSDWRSQCRVLECLCLSEIAKIHDR